MIGGNNPNDVFFDVCVENLVEVQLIEKWIGLERLSATTFSEMFYTNRVSLFIRCIMVHLVIIHLHRGQNSDIKMLPGTSGTPPAGLHGCYNQLWTNLLTFHTSISHESMFPLNTRFPSATDVTVLYRNRGERGRETAEIKQVFLF